MPEQKQSFENSDWEENVALFTKKFADILVAIIDEKNVSLNATHDGEPQANSELLAPTQKNI